MGPYRTALVLLVALQVPCDGQRTRGRGLRALRSTQGTGRPRKLTPAQERQVFRWVNGKRPDPYDFDFGLWTRQVVQVLVPDRFEISLSLASIEALLVR